MNINKLPILTIPGPPLVLKNSKKIIKAGKRFMVIPSDKVTNRIEIDTLRIRKQWVFPPIDTPIGLKIMTYGAWMKDDGNIPDASNLYEYPQDILQKAGVIQDDRLIEHHDGSRRVCLCNICPERRWKPKKKKWAKCGAVKKCDQEKTVIKIMVL